MKERGWISVKKRLPEFHSANVLCYSNTGRFFLSWIDRGTMEFDEHQIDPDVGERITHWRYLPQRPKIKTVNP